MSARLHAAPNVGDTGAFADLVNDLNGMQSAVQQYAPTLASQWGWLSQQGALLAAGQAAALTQPAWVAQYRSFFAALQSAEGGQDQQNAANAGVSPATFENLDIATQEAQSAGTALQTTAQTVAAPLTAGAAIGNAFAGVIPYLPWIVLGIAAIVIVPPLIRAATGDK